MSRDYAEVGDIFARIDTGARCEVTYIEDSNYQKAQKVSKSDTGFMVTIRTKFGKKAISERDFFDYYTFVSSKPNRINIGDMFNDPAGNKIKVVGLDGDHALISFVDDSGQYGDRYKILQSVLINDWFRIAPSVGVKCECGGDTAKTTHSDWCPKYKPYKSAKLFGFAGVNLQDYIEIGDIFESPQTGERIQINEIHDADTTRPYAVCQLFDVDNDKLLDITVTMRIGKLIHEWRRMHKHHFANLIDFSNLFFKLAQLAPGQSSLSLQDIQQQMQKWKSYIETASITERAGWGGQEGKLVLAVIDKILNAKPISGQEVKYAVLDINSNVPGIDAEEFQRYIDEYVTRVAY